MTVFRFTAATYTLAACLLMQPGDTMEIVGGGDFTNQVIGVRQPNTTFRGVPGPNGELPLFQAVIPAGQTMPPMFPYATNWSASWGGKGIFIVRADNCWIEGFELCGAKNFSSNGAGIAHNLGVNLTVKNCKIHDNQNGILGAEHDDPSTPSPDGGLVWLEGNEIFHNGAGDGQSHNLYISRAETLVALNNNSHSARGGHLIKTRAQNNVILGNTLKTGDGNPTYHVDIDGGNALVANNIMERTAVVAGSDLNQTCMIHYYLWHNNGQNVLRVYNNRLSCSLASHGHYVWANPVWDSRATAPAVPGSTGQIDVEISGNLCIAPTTVGPKGGPLTLTYAAIPWLVPAGANITGNDVFVIGSEPATGPTPLPLTITADTLTAFIASNMPTDAAPPDPDSLLTAEQKVALQAQVDSLTAQLKTSQDALVAAQANVATLNAQVQADAATAATTNAALAAVTQDRDALKAKIATVKADLDKAEADIAA